MLAKSLAKKAVYTVGLTIWVIASLLFGQILAGVILSFLSISLNSAIETTILAALSYLLGLAFAIGLPILATRQPVALKTLGIDRLPSWTDIGLSILAVLPYYLLSGLAIWFGAEIIKVINPDIGQQIGFNNLTLKTEYVVAFVTLVLLAPLAEELLFRGYFLGRLNDKIGKWLALLVTALAFGSLHLPGFTEMGIVLQWSAAADTFSLALVAGGLRLLSGSIWAGVLLHAIKNGIAYYFLFINPLPPGN